MRLFERNNGLEDSAKCFALSSSPQALRAVVLDKTGTITKGKPELTDVITLPGKAEQEMLRLVAEVEQGSEHPLAAAIIFGAKTRGIALHGTPEHVVALPGRGVKTVVEGHALLIGTRSLLAERSIGYNALAESFLGFCLSFLS